MKKNLFKFVLPTLLLVFFVPNVVLAAWWNPATWFNGWKFNKNKQSTEVLEDRIRNLEKQLQEGSVATDAVENSSDSDAESSSKADIKLVEPKKSPVVNIKTEVEKSETPVTQEKTEDVKEVVISQVPEMSFDVTRLTQTIFEETPSSWAYGGFEITLNITANIDDVFVPMTTSDSTKGVTGFIYSIQGDSFQGQQDSRVSCSRKTSDNYCRIAKGDSINITTTVWLTPSQSGNYGILFDKFKAKIGLNGVLKTYNLSQETEHIYVTH